MAAGCLIWMGLAVTFYSSAASIALSRQEIGFAITFFPITIPFVMAVAGLPAFGCFLALMLRHSAISPALGIMAIFAQVLTWPLIPECPSSADTCSDAVASYQMVVFVCWTLFGVALAILAKTSVDHDPYLIALRKRNEKLRNDKEND
jgi:hypothetical protein